MSDVTGLVARLVSLNTDHHRRMKELHDSRVGQPAGNAIEDMNQVSRDNLTCAMKGAASRYGLGGAIGGRLLELGASYGGERAYLVSSFQTTYVGVEVVPHVAEAAKELGVLNLALEEAPAVWDGSFDWVYSRHVMEHVPDVDVALATIKRILAPKGVFGAVTPNPPDNEPAHVCQLTAEQWMSKYRQHGLIPVYAFLQSHVGLTEVHLVVVHREALEAKLSEVGFPAAEKTAIRALLAQ